MKLSVIIVNYNVKYFLEQCLHSVSKASEKLAVEIIVVDNNSVDGSMAMVAQKFPTVIRIENKENVGFSRANNQAIHQANGEYILLLNPDTVVEENTFLKTIEFLDAHPEAGGLGVKMIDGSGRFLPESKRGLPTPAVAFYKITGLSSLFPGSKLFGQYHLGFLDKNKTHSVDVLSGAFMMLRKKVLDKTGLLDEDFFMYGEDIDLSYRIIKAGYKNYYFPETRIIHYKGESTKKSSVNYVLVFYQAMIIFAQKHFSKQHAAMFAGIIRSAIYVRAGIAVVTRIFSRIFLPLLDAVVFFTGFYFLQYYWSGKMNIQYPSTYLNLAVPGYILFWITGIYFSGGYERPIRIQKIIRGIVIGTLIILVVYALLPEHYRYSRALILLGTVWSVVAAITSRYVLSKLSAKQVQLESNTRKRLLITGSRAEASRILSLLKMTDSLHNFIGYASPADPDVKTNPDGFQKFHLGGIEKLSDLISVYQIDEVIFCAKDISSQQIISLMSTVVNREVEYKIAPPESMYIIGSSTVENTGELYTVDINSISKWSNRRNKRLLDLVLSFFFLLTSPILALFQQKPAGFISNIVRVLGGKISWVGYSNQSSKLDPGLPAIKKGVLNPFDAIGLHTADDQTSGRLNALYAKDYRIYTDLNIVLKNFTHLGRTT